MTRDPVLLAGATPLATALGVRLARANWPVAGLWDVDHARALVASLRIGCCAFAAPAEPLARAGIVLLGEPWTVAGPRVIALFLESGEESWLVAETPVTDPGLDLTGVSFRAGGAGVELARELGLICSSRGV